MTASNQKNGFIKIYRSMLNWEWWDDLNTFRLFVTILISVNWRERKWHGKTIPRGAMFTSLSSLSKKSGLTLRQTRTSLNHLISTNEVTSEVTNNGRLITVVNYDFYQDFEPRATNETTSELTNDRQSTDKRPTTTKEVKESKELNIVVVAPKSTKEFLSRLTDSDLNHISNCYPKSSGFLIDEVAEDVVRRKAKIKNPTRYILGYARRVNWDDNADHFGPFSEVGQ